MLSYNLQNQDANKLNIISLIHSYSTYEFELGELSSVKMQRKHAQLQVTKPRRSARGMIPNILRRKPNPENSHKEIKINSKRKCNFHKLLEPNLARCDDSEPNLAVANPTLRWRTQPRPESCLTCLWLAGQRNCGRRKAEGSSSSGGTARVCLVWVNHDLCV